MQHHASTSFTSSAGPGRFPGKRLRDHGCPGSHHGGTGWLGRWRQGLGGGFDLGLDAMGVQHGDQGAIDLKIAGRYHLSSHVRLELGVGGADDSTGKSLSAEVGLTAGTDRSERSWNYYGSLRLAGANGYPGDVFGSGAHGAACRHHGHWRGCSL
ncbi:MAG: hypothetical protein ABSG38_06015 [Spirochaetia bacterium]